MTVGFLKSYQLDITPLSPLHLGTGETYDPTAYVIDDGALCAFSPEDALSTCTADDRKTLLGVVSKRNPVEVLRSVQQFFFERRERLVPRSSHFVPVREANERFYLERVGTETNPGVTNLLDIERTAYDLAGGCPVLSGSGIKGAMRTALLDSVNGGRSTERDEKNVLLQQRLFGYQAGKFELDPMRLVQLGDASLQGARDLAATEIRFTLNRKKRRVLKDGAVLLSQAQQRNLSQVLETIRPLMPRAFRAQLNLQQCAGLDGGQYRDKLPRSDLRWTMEDIARACHGFYLAHFEREMAILKQREFVDGKWAEAVAGLLGSESRKRQMEQGRAFLLRVGRHSGAESVTLNGVRRIKILEGLDPETRKMRSSDQSEAKTLWLAGDDPNASENMLPFGWLLVEITPQGAEPPPWSESFDEYHKPAREWRRKLDARLGELRARQAEEDQRRLAAEERARCEAETRAAEAARVAAMGPEERRIADVRAGFEQARERNERKAGGPLAQLFNDVVEEAKNWSAPRREALTRISHHIPAGDRHCGLWGLWGKTFLGLS